MRKYRCFFEFGQRVMHVEDDEVAQFLAGFWITADFQYARWCGSQAKYFIPASRVLYIEKIS